MSKYIVFYGTLKPSHKTKMHSLINRDLEHIGRCTLAGQLYKKARYPVLKPGDGHVKGELYKIHNYDILNKLDNYEAVDNEDSTLPGFTRASVKLVEPKLTAWVYYYDGPVAESELIASGCWK